MELKHDEIVSIFLHLPDFLVYQLWCTCRFLHRYKTLFNIKVLPHLRLEQHHKLLRFFQSNREDTPCCLNIVMKNKEYIFRANVNDMDYSEPVFEMWNPYDSRIHDKVFVFEGEQGRSNWILISSCRPGYDVLKIEILAPNWIRIYIKKKE